MVLKTFSNESFLVNHLCLILTIHLAGDTTFLFSNNLFTLFMTCIIIYQNWSPMTLSHDKICHTNFPINLLCFPESESRPTCLLLTAVFLNHSDQHQVVRLVISVRFQVSKYLISELAYSKAHHPKHKT